jgi:hypothetical protein
LEVKQWEIIADRLSKAGWSWGCVSAVTSEGRIIWVADAQNKNKNITEDNVDEGPGST